MPHPMPPPRSTPADKRRVYATLYAILYAFSFYLGLYSFFLFNRRLPPPFFLLHHLEYYRHAFYCTFVHLYDHPLYVYTTYPFSPFLSFRCIVPDFGRTYGGQPIRIRFFGCAIRILRGGRTAIVWIRFSRRMYTIVPGDGRNLRHAHRAHDRQFGLYKSSLTRRIHSRTTRGDPGRRQ